MKKVAILIPASPNPAFFSQIAAFTLALSKLDWSRWDPTVYVFLGGEPDFDALQAWRPYLRDTMMTFVSASLSDAHRFYYAQIDSVFRCAPTDADVLIRMDADTLVVRNFEDLLDYVVDTNSVAAGWASLTCSPVQRSSLDMPTLCYSQTHRKTERKTIGPRHST
jgi:hypothetical protein